MESEKISRMKIEIYIHIPFCVSKCGYCDFLSGPASDKEKAEYVELLCQEIETCRENIKECEVSSIFFGGGTPSLLNVEQVERLMGTIKNVFRMCEDAEVTLEMNPGTVTKEKLEGFKTAGINRLSIGLQSVHNKELKMLGRIHTFEEFLESYRFARKVGFENINIDLISAIPGQTTESWREALETVIGLEPEHISAYSLIVEPGTPFYELYEEQKGLKREELPNEEAERQMYHDTKEILKASGYHRYEISNYSRPSFQCRHNLGYWDRVPYLGFGIGAASLMSTKLLKNNQPKERMSRYTNPDSTAQYLKSFHKKFAGDLLTKEEEMEEFMFLGLRKMEGISKKDFRAYFHTNIKTIYNLQIEKLKSLNLIKEDIDNICLTEQGIDLSNTVFMEFLQ